LEEKQVHYSWDERGIAWFLDASEYTGFHKALAQKIIPHLSPDDALCDAGCGLGRLDLELARHVRELTAVDISEDAIAALRRDAETLGVQNMRTIVSDAAMLDGTFDIVLLSFFGQSNMLDFLKLCRRKLIRVVSVENASTLYPQRHRNNVRDTVEMVQDYLGAQGIRYELELASIEFGQPLRTWQDAEKYILKNAPGATAEEVGGFLDEHLTKTGRDDFPFYLPNKKGLGIFVIDKEGKSR
jgi:SAM-dependent methyltransferase